MRAGNKQKWTSNHTYSQKIKEVLYIVLKGINLSRGNHNFKHTNTCVLNFMKQTLVSVKMPIKFSTTKLSDFSMSHSPIGSVVV